MEAIALAIKTVFTSFEYDATTFLSATVAPLNVPPVAVNDTLVDVSAYSESFPPVNTVAVCAVPVVASLASKPSDLAVVPVDAVNVA